VNKVVGVNVNPPNCTFFRRLHFGP